MKACYAAVQIKNNEAYQIIIEAYTKVQLVLHTLHFILYTLGLL